MHAGSLMALASLCATLVLALPTAHAGIEPVSPPPSRPWSDGYPQVRKDLEAGKPLVIEVLVALCDNRQIWCGSKWAGQAASPQTNIYWGAQYGARTHFEREDAGWTRLEVQTTEGAFLQRAVYRRLVAARHWGLKRPGEVEQIVVLHAVHGRYIHRAVEQLYVRAARGSAVAVPGASGGHRRLRAHAVGYVGHNRLMDGIRFPPALPPAQATHAPIPSFVLACHSERYFSHHLKQVGSEPVVMTRTFMAPEGYVVDAVVKGLGDNETHFEIRQRAVEAYAKWQRLSHTEANVIFAGR